MAFYLPQPAAAGAVEHPGDVARRPGGHAAPAAPAALGQDLPDDARPCFAGDQEQHAPGAVQDRIGEAHPPHLRAAALHGSGPARRAPPGPGGCGKSDAVWPSGPTPSTTRSKTGSAVRTAGRKCVASSSAYRSAADSGGSRPGPGGGRPAAREVVDPVRAGRAEVAGRVVVGHQTFVHPEQVQPLPGDDVRHRGPAASSRCSPRGVCPPEIAIAAAPEADTAR